MGSGAAVAVDPIPAGVDAFPPDAISVDAMTVGVDAFPPDAISVDATTGGVDAFSSDVVSVAAPVAVGIGAVEPPSSAPVVDDSVAAQVLALPASVETGPVVSVSALVDAAVGAWTVASLPLKVTEIEESVGEA